MVAINKHLITVNYFIFAYTLLRDFEISDLFAESKICKA